MESSTEDNQIQRRVGYVSNIPFQIHWPVLLDHKMIIEGIQYHEKKELQLFDNEDGVEISNLSHMRSIGDRTYTVNQKIVDGACGEVKDETIETTLAEDEVDAFKKNWEDNWHPMIGERLKKLDDFLI